MKSFGLSLALLTALLTNLSAQSTFSESFTGTTASGWVFGGNYTPNLTANTIDTPGDGWLRLTDNANNRATYALLDTQIFSVNAQISISMDYAFYNGSGADGITFFLVDGSTSASSLDVGSYGGSMGYAQRTGEGGMVGGYLGFALDNYGNYSNGSEGRNGGITNDGTLYANRVAVRGPESSNYEFIAASAPLAQSMDFPGSTTRPVQTGTDYRSFQIVLDANNQLEVFMKFDYNGSYTSVFTADLSAYDRPETFKLGFTGATGGSTEIHEVRNLAVTTTPWSTGSGAYEWDNGAGTTTWGTLIGGEANSNWFSSISGDNNKTPLRDSDVLFGNKPTSNGPTNTQSVALGNDVEVRNMTFDTGINYSIGTVGDGRTITFGDTGKAGLPSINVNNYNDANARHKINSNITLVEELRINNYSFSTLCLNGTLETAGNDITVNGYGAVNFNGDISGSGDLEKNGRGIVTINNNNSDDPTGSPTAWSGNVVINQGMVVVTVDGALGNTTGTTTVNNGGTLALRGGVAYATTEAVTITGRGVERGTNQSAGAIYNDGGTNSFAGAVTLAADAAVGSRDGVLTLSGVVSDGASTYNLTKVGDGVVALSNSGNNYNGATIIEAGVLRVTGNSAALAGGFTTNGYTGGNLTLAGGVLEIGVNVDFTRSIGTGSDQVSWSGDGGFSAFGGNRNVQLNNGTANVTWGSTGFVGTGYALLLSSDYADSRITLENDLSFNNAQREVRVADGSATVDARLRGRLRGGNNASGTGGLIKTGEGTLELNNNTGNASDYSGATEIRAGALRVSNSDGFSVNSNIQLNGGVFEVGVDLDASGTDGYAATLGTAGGNVQFTGSGGFSASGGDRTITLNSGAGLTWNSTSGFLTTGSTLVLGSKSATANAIFANAINLNGAERTVRVLNGTGSEDGRLAGVISGSGGALRVEGTGSLGLTAANTYTGATTVSGAEVRLSGAGTLASTSGVTLNQGGSLILDNATTNNTDRIGSVAVAMNGGRLDLIGRDANTTATTETLGQLQLGGGENQINVARSGNTGTSTDLTFSDLTRTTGSTLEFTRSGTTGAFGTDANVKFTTAPTREQGILAYAVAGNGATPTGFATHAGNGTAITVAAGSNVAEGSWVASTIQNNGTSDIAITANRTVGALILGNGADVTQTGTRTLTIETGGILSTGTASSIATSNLQVGGTGTRELYTHVYGSGALTISSVIQNNSNTTGLTKSGSGTLILSGTAANTFTGTTYVNDGLLILNKSTGVTALAGDVIVGDGRGRDTLEFEVGADNQLATTSDVTLRGGLTGASATTANQATLDLNGTTQTFDQLTIEGNSVIDFSGGDPCAPTFLKISDINFVGTATLTIKNWVEFTDFFLVESSATIDFSRITFEGYGGQAQWQDYSTGWKQIMPIPEPSTYGAIFIGGAVAFHFLRRRRRV